MHIFFFLCLFFLSIPLHCEVKQATEDPYMMERLTLVNELRREGIQDERVLKAFMTLKRHLFVPKELAARVYENTPLPIGFGQTISQPFIVAFMTEALGVKDGDKILEVGTGSGFQAAVLGQINPSGMIYSIEVVEPLAIQSKKLLRELGHTNISVKAGDGYKGWPEHEPFDKIILTAAPETIPEVLLLQLKIGGILIAPIGTQHQGQDLVRVTRVSETDFEEEKLLDVRFVPMVKK